MVVLECTTSIYDDAALGRQTRTVRDPDEPSQVLDSFILESQPAIVLSLAKEGFRAVRVACGESISVFLDEQGRLYSCGCFRVRYLASITHYTSIVHNMLVIRRDPRLQSMFYFRTSGWLSEAPTRRPTTPCSTIVPRFHSFLSGCLWV